MSEATVDRAPLPAGPPKRRAWLRRLLLGLAIFATLLLVVAGGAALWLHSRFQGSLPDESGRLVLAGLEAPVTVERDALGVPTIHGASRLDVARATGFLHGQERFFQMDMMLRRRAAGELAALVGERGLGADQAVRIHRFRERARQAVDRLPADQRALLEAYSEGVNAGLEALEAPPFEYVLLFTDPEPWRPEDSLLAVFAMYLELHAYTIEMEDNLHFMREELEPRVFELLTPLGTEWDAPMEGPVFTGSDFSELVAATTLPDRALSGASAGPVDGGEIPGDGSEDVAGSNAWALAGRHTESGAPLLANDMHLQLSVPGLWYRASFRWPGEDGKDRRVTGVTLPGMPLMVVGSNGKVAWGFTASLIDVADLVLLELDPERRDHYLTPEGPRPFEAVEEVIRVRGGDPIRLGFLSTEWGPVLPDSRLDRDWALHWVAYEPGAVDLGALGLETAASVEEALLVARSSGAPAQNVVAADAAGHVGWSIFGRVPNRVGFTGRLPVSWADGTHRWEGFVEPERVPAIVDPEGGVVWNANNRTVGGEAYAVLGDGGYRSGARALQIRDALFEMEAATEEDMLALQRDDRALFLERWHRLLMEEVLTPQALEGHPRRQELRDAIADWEGRAAVDAVAFRLVRAYRFLLAQDVFDGLTAELREIDPGFGLLRYPHYEEPLWWLVTQRPPELLDPRYETWDEQLLAMVDHTVELLSAGQPDTPLDRMYWGSANATRVSHPLSGGLPFLGRWLDMPVRALPGAEEMPLAQRSDYGASVRMVVTPGREEQGYAHVPMGQSGHPLSPHYADSFETWAGEGGPTPFLPGPPQTTLVLAPAGAPPGDSP